MDGWTDRYDGSSKINYSRPLLHQYYDDDDDEGVAFDCFEGYLPEGT